MCFSELRKYSYSIQNLLHSVKTTLLTNPLSLLMVVMELRSVSEKANKLYVGRLAVMSRKVCYGGKRKLGAK